MTYRVLKEHGIKPWEFGALTLPWLDNILRKGKPRMVREGALAAQARHALALARCQSHQD